MDAVNAPAGNDAFEAVLESDSPLIIYETSDPSALVEQFRLRARGSGQAVYHWTSEAGLVSLREGAVGVPGCRRFVDTLRYVMQSIHFGIYLIDDVSVPLADAEIRQLRQIAKLRTNHVRRVVLMCADTRLEASLGEAVVMRQAERIRYRLRDGHWVR